MEGMALANLSRYRYLTSELRIHNHVLITDKSRKLR